MRRFVYLVLFVGLLFVSRQALAARDVPVPSRCIPQVNQRLADLIASGTRSWRRCNWGDELCCAF